MFVQRLERLLLLSKFPIVPKLPSLSGAEIVKTLEALGFQKVRQRGSHVVLRNNESTCVVPLHNQVKLGTLRSILRQANVNVQRFLDTRSGI